MTRMTVMQENGESSAGYDIIALGIAASAILMFVGTGSAVLPEIFRNWAGVGPGPDLLLVNALLLNIALIIFGWRRYSELQAELEQHRMAEKSARILAETDVLTNCLNRRRFTPEADALIELARASGKHTAFIMLDLDNFKQINDCYGHQVGDLVLKTAAERIKSILPSGSLLARLGGDEFACVVSFDQAYRSRVDQLVNRLIHAVSQPIPTEVQEVEVTISAGISAVEAKASHASGALDAKCLLHYADIAMYHAKKHGRNCYSWFEIGMKYHLSTITRMTAISAPAATACAGPIATSASREPGSTRTAPSAIARVSRTARVASAG